MPQFFSLVGAVPLALCLALLAVGCGVDPDAAGQPFYPASERAFQALPAQDVPRDSVVALLQSLRTEAIDTAFARLPTLAFTRRVRTEQVEAGRVLASRTRTLRYPGGRTAPTLLHRDSSGTFDFGLLGWVAQPDARQDAAATLAPHIVPDDPAYLSPRNQEAYTYRLLPDTALAGRAAQVIDVQARPDAQSDLSIRHARFFVDRASGRLVAVRLARSKRAFLFDEDSRFFVRLQPGPEGQWVPHSTRYWTRLDLPLGTPRQFRTDASYTRYGAAR